MRACASRPSSRRSQCTCVPRPTGTPRASTSNTPPTDVPRAWASSTLAMISRVALGSAQRTGEASACSAISSTDNPSVVARTPPISTTWPRTRTPNARNRHLHTPPTATRIAVSRAEARSRTLRRSRWSYLRPPARSAWPGRGRVMGGRCGAPWTVGTPTAMVSCQFSQSRFSTRRLMGLPSVLPCRTPPRIRTASFSIFIRPPRPYPPIRRVRSRLMSVASTGTWDGIPSRMATRAGPWDSPAVKYRSMSPSVGGVGAVSSGIRGCQDHTPRECGPKGKTHPRGAFSQKSCRTPFSRSFRSWAPPEWSASGRSTTRPFLRGRWTCS